MRARKARKARTTTTRKRKIAKKPAKRAAAKTPAARARARIAKEISKVKALEKKETAKHIKALARETARERKAWGAFVRRKYKGQPNKIKRLIELGERDLKRYPPTPKGYTASSPQMADPAYRKAIGLKPIAEVQKQRAKEEREWRHYDMAAFIEKGELVKKKPAKKPRKAATKKAAKKQSRKRRKATK